jgi:hypothetical protein
VNTSSCHSIREEAANICTLGRLKYTAWRMKAGEFSIVPANLSLDFGPSFSGDRKASFHHYKMGNDVAEDCQE